MFDWVSCLNPYLNNGGRHCCTHHLPQVICDHAWLHSCLRFTRIPRVFNPSPPGSQPLHAAYTGLQHSKAQREVARYNIIKWHIPLLRSTATMASGATFVSITAMTKIKHCNATPLISCNVVDYGYELNARLFFFLCSNFQIRIFCLHNDTKHSLSQINGSYLYE